VELIFHAGDFVFPGIIDEFRISQNEVWHPKIFGVFRRGMRKHAITPPRFIPNTDYVSAAFLFSNFHNSIKLHCNRLSV